MIFQGQTALFLVTGVLLGLQLLILMDESDTVQLWESGEPFMCGMVHIFMDGMHKKDA